MGTFTNSAYMPYNAAFDHGLNCLYIRKGKTIFRQRATIVLLL